MLTRQPMSLGCLRGVPNTTPRCALMSMKEEAMVNHAVDKAKSLLATASMNKMKSLKS